MPTILVVQHSLKLDNFQNGQIAVKCQALKTPSTNNPFFSSTVCQLFLVLYTVWKKESSLLFLYAAFGGSTFYTFSR